MDITASNQTEAEWGCWSDWSSCSTTCGGSGTRSRTGECQPGMEINGTQSTECDGDGIESEACTKPECPIIVASSASWSEWTSWSTCTVTCGGPGQRSRSRNCIPEISLEHHDNIICNGDSKEVLSCGDFTCPQAKHCPPGFQHSIG